MVGKVLQAIIVQLQVKLASLPISMAVIKLLLVTVAHKEIRQIVALQVQAEAIPPTAEGLAAEEAGMNKIMDVLVAVVLEDILVLVAKVIATHHIVAEILEPVLEVVVEVVVVQHLHLALAVVEAVLAYMAKDLVVVVVPVLGMVRPARPPVVVVVLVEAPAVVGK